MRKNINKIEPPKDLKELAEWAKRMAEESRKMAEESRRGLEELEKMQNGSCHRCKFKERCPFEHNMFTKTDEVKFCPKNTDTTKTYLFFNEARREKLARIHRN